MKTPLSIQKSIQIRAARSLHICCVVLASSMWWSAPTYAGWTEGSVAFQRGDYAAALSELEPAANLGDPRAQRLLGFMYETGKGVTMDDAASLSWTRKAAEGGDALAQHNLGWRYAAGRGVPRNDGQAVYWFRSAAEQLDTTGQVDLAQMYAEGRGVTKDDKLAVSWYRKAAEAGNLVAQNNLANMYRWGRGVEKSEQEAIAWYRRAAEKGYDIAQFNLGNSYSNGIGVTRDDVVAGKWYQKAADQGNAMAKRSLGWMYANGLGIAKDEQQALAWYRKAANQGEGVAQALLGDMYAEGRGVPRDEQQAYFWYLLASGQSVEHTIPRRDRVERLLSVSQRGEAQAAARNWKPDSSDSTAGRSSPFSGATDSPTVPAHVRPATPDSTGSGFAITPTQVVTNAHVVEGCGRVTLGGGQPATVSSSETRSDLALLAVAPRSSFGVLRSGRLRQGDTVTVVGYPLRGLLANGAQVTAGNVSALAGMQNDSRFIQITAPVQPGNSGGPLVDSSGNVVGVVVSKLNAVKMAQLTGDIPQNVNFAVSPLTLQGFLDANGVEYQTSPSNKNLSTADVADIAKRFTVLVECWKQ